MEDPGQHRFETSLGPLQKALARERKLVQNEQGQSSVKEQRDGLLEVPADAVQGFQGDVTELRHPDRRNLENEFAGASAHQS